MFLKLASVFVLATAAVIATSDQVTINEIILRRGVIGVKDSSGALNGYVSSGRASEFNPWQYTPLLQNTLAITMNVSGQGPVDIVSRNSPSNSKPPRHCFAAMKGVGSTSSDMGKGSSNYQVLMATTPTPPGSPPVPGPQGYTIESAIWKYDTKTSAISAQYINTDGSAPPTFIGLWQDLSEPSGEVFILTGDKDKFIKDYGTAKWVDFSLLI